MTDAVSALAERMAEDLCLGFRWHDQRDRERAVEAFARVDAHQFAHVGADVAREAARAYVDALWVKDEIEAACIPASADEPDYERLADADWSAVERAFAERADLVGIDPVYATASTLAWKRHKVGGDYWTPMLRSEEAELRAAMQEAYPEKTHEGQSGFGAEAVRYLLGVELHDMHTEGHWRQAKTAMTPYFETILRSHDHHRPPAEEQVEEQEVELVTDGGTVGGKASLRCGDRVRDLDNEDDDAHVYVVEQLDEPIDEYVLYTTDHGSEQTVYDYTRGDYDADEPVVRVVFEENLAQFLDSHTLTRDEVLEICHDLDVEKLDTRWGFLTVYAYPRSRLGEPDRVVTTDGGLHTVSVPAAGPEWTVTECFRGPPADEDDCCDRCDHEFDAEWRPFIVIYENGIVEDVCHDCKPDDRYIADGGTADLPPPKDGADPWCTWCDEDLNEAEAVWMIEGRDDSRWPAAFCSEHCAREWGCAADQERVFRVENPDEVIAR